MMEQALAYIQSNVELAPYLVCGLLLLAGLNIPISEDAMIFVSAMLSAVQPEHTIKLFTGLFVGAYVSDVMCFYLGYLLGDKLWNIKWFAGMVKKENVSKLNSFYEKYGVYTLILGRFIPFGVRNGLFLTAGVGKMKPSRFILSDLVACSISVTIYFILYFKYGQSVVQTIKQSNYYIFAFALLLVLFLVIKKQRAKKNI
jgi:membrane-associated protein